MVKKTKELLNDEEILKKPTNKVEKNEKTKNEEKSEKKSTSKTKTVKITKSSKIKNVTEKEPKPSKVTKSKSSSATKSKKEENLKKTAKTKSATSKVTKKTTTKKSTTKKVAEKKPKVFTPEYYDLPYRYNQTVVKILAQTPSSLFIYWDISDEDRNRLKETYGKYIFEITKPVLIIHNLTMNYSFEIDINDFANSWYLHLEDSKCEYDIELGRRPIPVNYSYFTNYEEEPENIEPIKVPYIYISSSNKIETPNNKILFNKGQNTIYFRNVKTNKVIAKDITNFIFVSNIGKFYSISELYNKFYREDEIIRNDYILNNPSSGNPSSNSSSSFR